MASARIPLQYLRAFHSIDQNAYHRLMNLGFNSLCSKKIIAFWLWLEAKDFRNFVFNTQTLDQLNFLSLAHETITCLATLNHGLFFAINHSLPVMRSLVGSRPVSREWIYCLREEALTQVNFFMNNVCNPAFTEMVPVTSRTGAQIFEPGFRELAQERYAAQGLVNQELHEAQGQVNQERHEAEGQENQETQEAQGPVNQETQEAQGQVNQEHHEAESRVNQETQEAQGQVNQEPVGMQQSEEFFVGRYGKDAVDFVPKDLLHELA